MTFNVDFTMPAKRLLTAFAALLMVVGVAQISDADTTHILADVQLPGGVASTFSDFAAADAGIVGGTVTPINSTGATTIGDFGVTLSAGGGPFNAGATTDTFGIPIIEGYQFLFNQESGTAARTIDITGISSINAGDLVTLTLFGQGDNTAIQTQFGADYNGVDLGTLVTPAFNAASPSSSSVQFTFAAAAADTVNITWGRPDGVFSGAAGFNGLSLTSAPASVPEPGSMAVVSLLGLAGFLRRRRN
jgi:hypothetical protein